MYVAFPEMPFAGQIIKNRRNMDSTSCTWGNSHKKFLETRLGVVNKLGLALLESCWIGILFVDCFTREKLLDRRIFSLCLSPAKQTQLDPSQHGNPFCLADHSLRLARLNKWFCLFLMLVPLLTTLVSFEWNLQHVENTPLF